MLKQAIPYRLFLLWSIYFGVISFLIWLSWYLNYLTRIFLTDPTMITYLVGMFFIGGTIHCGIRSWYLSTQVQAIHDISTRRLSFTESNSLPAQFLNTINDSLIQQGNNTDNSEVLDKTLLTEVFSAEAHSQHEMGWFVTSLLVKLGLLGTVIGFVLMLQPLSTLESFEISDIQGVLTNMTSGMSVALNTTLLGLISSMALSFQYLLLDRGADELVARTIHFMETTFLTSSQTHKD